MSNTSPQDFRYVEYDSAEDTFSDGDESDVSGYNSDAELPEVVKIELERRREAKERGEPPRPPDGDAVRALRVHFESGAAVPFLEGGFVSLMWKLGATPRSDDRLVKETQYNIWYLGPKGEDTEEWWRTRIEEHEAEVRLLRYGEFIESQQAKGLGPRPGWSFHNYDDEGDEDDAAAQHEGVDETKSSSAVNDYNLTKEQLLALSKGFTMGFWNYANHDKVYHGLAHGVRVDKGPALPRGARVPGGTRLLHIDLSEDSIIDQCVELRDRYIDQGRPLGLPAKTSRPPPKGFGKRNRRRQQQKGAGARTTATDRGDHAAAVTEHIKTLFATLEKQLLTSAAIARVLSAIINMLGSAVEADPDVARSLADGDGPGAAILRLRGRALEHALAADADASRPKWAADAWWQAHSLLTELLGNTISTLGTPVSCFIADADAPSPDAVLAADFFDAFAAPALLRSISSAAPAAEREPSLVALGRASCAVPRDRALALVRDKRTWRLLEAACAGTAAEASVPPSPPAAGRAERRELRFAPRAAAAALALLAQLCGRGMTLDDSVDARTPVAPAPLAAKMIERGVVPLLVTVARSAVGLVSTQAMSGLAQISRVKDCRAILLQEPDGMGLVRDMLSSSDGKKVSEAMLLAVHLLWDEEWRGPLLAVDPPIETTALRWAAYSMKCIRERADETREGRKRRSEKHVEDLIRNFATPSKAKSQEDRDKMQLQLDENVAKMKNEIGWLELETEKCRGEPWNNTLCRSLILLSSMLHNRDAPGRLLNAGALPLAAACIDCPVDDTHGPAANIISNFIACGGAAVVSADRFPDPDHVVRAVISRLGKLADFNDFSQCAVIFVRLGTFLRQAPGWAPYFDSLAACNPEAKFMIESFLPRLGGGMSQVGICGDTGEVPCKEQPGLSTTEDRATIDTGVNYKCSTLTGKLRKCEECGKIESKKGDFKACARCMVAKYCGRDCQRRAWKRHKKQCASVTTKKTAN